jgi:hypothetical protein
VPVGLSLPNALRAAIPAGAGSAGSLYKNFDGSPLACDFDVKLPAALPSGYVYLAGLYATGNGDTSTVSFGREGGWRIKVDNKAADGGSFARSPEFPDPPIGAWFHVRLAMTAAESSIAIDGMVRATVALPAASAMTLTKFAIGLLDSSIVDGIEIFFDNVACGPI